MKKNLTFFLYVVLALLALSCETELPNAPKPNQSPSTRLWITSESSLNATVSRQHLYFYGEDPDGTITGFLIAYAKDTLGTLTQIPNPDTLTYVWTTRNDTTVALPLLQKRDKFAIIVRAVDNRFSGNDIPSGAIIRGFPTPYWDRDLDGMKGGSEPSLPAMQEGIDPKGAIQLFPLKNTPPTVRFAVTADENATTIEQPDTTYTVATFSWVGTDDDGNNTITGYRIALNDSSDSAPWAELPASATTVTLLVKRSVSDLAGPTVDAELYTGLFNNDRMVNTGKMVPNLRLNAQNVLYLQAKDIAGEYSSRVRMPSTSAKIWFVKKPQSRMLVVADYDNVASKEYILNYYRDIFSDKSSPRDGNTFVAGGKLGNFDVLNEVNFPATLNPAFIKTLQLYDLVLWFTDINPNLTAAQIGLRSYTDIGGKVIFITQFKSTSNPNYLYSDLMKYRDFLPLDPERVMTDSLKYISDNLYFKDLRAIDTTTTPRTYINVRILPMQDGYPVLYSDSVRTGGSIIPTITGSHSGVAFRKIFKNSDSQYLYKIISSHTSPPEYQGELELACIDNQKRVVVFAMPLHLLNGWEHNLRKFFIQVIENEFGIR